LEQLIGVEERVDPPTVFGERMKIRREAKKAFVRADSSARFAKAMLRKAAPLVRDYRARDLISFQREQISDGIARKRWSSASRIIGFEGQKVCWVICEDVPYCVATDRMRPANESEALAYQYPHDQENPMLRGQRQSFVDHAIQPDEDEAEAPDLVVESEESVTGSAEQQGEVRSDSEDEDDVMPLPQIVRTASSRKATIQCPERFTCRSIENLFSGRMFDRVTSTICCTNAIGNRVTSQFSNSNTSRRKNTALEVAEAKGCR
jgi:hypothetical protein